MQSFLDLCTQLLDEHAVAAQTVVQTDDGDTLAETEAAPRGPVAASQAPEPSARASDSGSFSCGAAATVTGAWNGWGSGASDSSWAWGRVITVGLGGE